MGELLITKASDQVTSMYAFKRVDTTREGMGKNETDFSVSVLACIDIEHTCVDRADRVA